MAKRKTLLATGTALVEGRAAPFILNADREHDPTNPHSWLPLLGDPSGVKGVRVAAGSVDAVLQRPGRYSY